MRNDYDEEQSGQKKAKIALVIASLLVLSAIVFGMYQAGKAIANAGSKNAQTEVQETPEQELPSEEDDASDHGYEVVSPEDVTEDGATPFDGGAPTGTDTVYDFGTFVRMPSVDQAEVDRIIGETELVPDYLGLTGTPIEHIRDCQYLSTGYFACPVGGPYLQIIDSVYQTTFAFAKKGSEIPVGSITKFKENFSEAEEGIGGGILDGYYVVSRGAVQNLTSG